jgi:hypothetical protein
VSPVIPLGLLYLPLKYHTFSLGIAVPVVSPF